MTERKNPGPPDQNHSFSTGFFSFCNWNLNTLSKDNYSRISLLAPYNATHNYDIISLCETSLNDEISVPENALPGYIYYPLNHPEGLRSGGVGIFYKCTLPLRIQDDLSFDKMSRKCTYFWLQKVVLYCSLSKSRK